MISFLIPVGRLKQHASVVFKAALAQQIAEPVGNVVEVFFGCLHAGAWGLRVAISVFDSFARDSTHH